MFGHGVSFKTIKWPPVWYSVWMALDTVGRYPQLWSGPDADLGDRRAVAELVACLIAYNVVPDGTVTPRSCYRGFTGFSFGVKKRPSPIATAMTAKVARRFSAIADDINAVDVLHSEALGNLRSQSGRCDDRPCHCLQAVRRRRAVGGRHPRRGGERVNATRPREEGSHEEAMAFSARAGAGDGGVWRQRRA
jgi:hypothetical protein